MNHVVVVVVAVAAVLFLGLAPSGCTSTGQAEYVQAEAAYIGAVDTVTELVRSGALGAGSVDALRAFDAAERAAYAILQEWSTAIEMGVEWTGEDRWYAALTALAQAAAALEESAR